MIVNDRMQQAIRNVANRPRETTRKASPASVGSSGSLQSKVKQQSQQLMEDAGRLVAKYPEWSLLAAISTGLFIGYLLKRK